MRSLIEFTIKFGKKPYQIYTINCGKEPDQPSSEQENVRREEDLAKAPKKSLWLNQLRSLIELNEEPNWIHPMNFG